MLQHRLATPVIQPRMHFFDKDGKPLIGGKIYSYKVGTDEFRPTYRNSEFTASNTNPIVLDSKGSALIYIRGTVQLRVFDKQGNHVENRIEYQQRERAQFYDDYGKPLKNGFVYTYDYQSTIRKTSYSIDNVINPNPIVLDENGTALVNIVGAYRLRQYNSKNVFVGDQDFKRPPIKALTSRPYPLYHEEYTSCGFGINDVAYDEIRWHESNLNEDIGVGFSVQDVYMRDSAPIPHIEDIGAGLVVSNVILSGLSKTNLGEEINASLTVNNVLYAIPINNYHTEYAVVSLSVNDATIEYL